MAAPRTPPSASASQASADPRPRSIVRVRWEWIAASAHGPRHRGWRVRCPACGSTFPEDSFLLGHHVYRCRHRVPPGHAGPCGQFVYVLWEDRYPDELLVVEIWSLDEIRWMQYHRLDAEAIKAVLHVPADRSRIPLAA